MSDKQEQQQATPLEALQFLDNALSQIAGSRKDHVALQGAVGIIGTALSPKEPEEDPKA